MADNKTESFEIMPYVAAYLTGEFQYSGELQAFWMAVEGSMTVRKGLNKAGKLHWFHAFCLSVAAGFTGGWLGFFLMGLPSSMLFNDINFAACIIAFLLVNYTPFDMGYKLLNTLPCQLLTVAFAQLFRSTAIAKFSDTCNATFIGKASPYYPMVIFGPILYPTLLGNWGGFLVNGFSGYLKDGMPWGFQNGFFTSTVYHFLVHDDKGPIGAYLRQAVAPVAVRLGLDTHTLGMCFVSAWMQVFGLVRMPSLLGPKYTPFTWPELRSGGGQAKPNNKATVAAAYPPPATTANGQQQAASKKKRKSKTKKE